MGSVASVAYSLNNLSALPMTMSDAPMSATTAIHSVAVPANAMARNAALSVNEKAMFIRMFFAAALTLNLSKGGVAIRTMSPLADGSKARVRFRLPGSKRDIEAESRVAWSDRRMGMGLQFEKVAPEDQAAIDEFVDQHFFTNRKA